MVIAKLNREYALRLIGVGVMMVGICLWSIYDGAVAYPKINATLESVREELLATNLTVTAWLDREEDGKTPLDLVFVQKGTTAPSKLVKKIGGLKLPKELANDTAAREKQAKDLRELLEKPIYSAQDLTTQFVQAGITLFLGLLAFGVIAFRATRHYIADEQGLRGTGIGPQPLAYQDIADMDWSRWQDKGIVRLTRSDKQVLTLDGWYYSGITQIVDEIVAHRPDLAGERAEKQLENGNLKLET
jgi:hypothetical protein